MSPSPAFGDRFELGEVLVETPFERCFRAFDTVLQRDVMLKVPAAGAHAGWSAPVRERLLREARALANVRHPNVTPIHWVETTADGPLLVFDLPEGEPLAERLERGPLDVAETTAIGREIAGALAEVHRHGVVHRAVGPSSIRLCANGRIVLGAFTFAKEFAPRGQMSSLAHVPAGEVARPEHLPDYSAPEQLAGQAADPRADVYALGCTLFRCLVGRDPFPAGASDGKLPDLRRLRPDVDRGLAEVIRKCTLFAKSARYTTATEVEQALRALPQRGADRRARRGLVAAAAAAALALLAWGTSGLLAGGPVDRGPGSEPAAPRAVDGRAANVYEPGYAHLHGLFVAIDEAYDGRQWPKLVHPTREAAQLVAQLVANDPQWSAPGAVTPLFNEAATAAAIRAWLDRVEKEAGPEDGVLVYFAGHGARDLHSFGLCAADAAGHVERNENYVRRAELQNFMDRCAAKHVLTVLDCCHSAAVFDVEPTRGRNPPGDVEAFGPHHCRGFAREFLCSARANEPAADASPFFRALLAELEPRTDGREYVAAVHLAGRIEEAMERGPDAGRRQMATYERGAGQTGSFVFRLAAAK